MEPCGTPVEVDVKVDHAPLKSKADDVATGNLRSTVLLLKTYHNELILAEV